MTARLYEIAVRKAAKGHESYGIDLLVDEPETMFCVWEGSGPHAVSANVSAQQLMASWREHLRLSGAEWLIPLLARMASGEKAKPTAILEGYRAHHGRPARPHQG